MLSIHLAFYDTFDSWVCLLNLYLIESVMCLIVACIVKLFARFIAYTVIIAVNEYSNTQFVLNHSSSA